MSLVQLMPNKEMLNEWRGMLRGEKKKGPRRHKRLSSKQIRGNLGIKIINDSKRLYYNSLKETEIR